MWSESTYRRIHSHFGLFDVGCSALECAHDLIEHFDTSVIVPATLFWRRWAVELLDRIRSGPVGKPPTKPQASEDVISVDTPAPYFCHTPINGTEAYNEDGVPSDLVIFLSVQGINQRTPAASNALLVLWV